MKKRALLVGINKYQVLGDLKYAHEDATAFAQALRQYWDFSDEEIIEMSCQSEGMLLPNSHCIETQLGNLVDSGDLDLLVFGFWGHGFSPEPGKRCLCGIDTNKGNLERTAVSLDVVTAKLRQMQADNTLVVLDCCQNRSSGRSVSSDVVTDGEDAAANGMARDIQVAHRGPHTNPTVAVLRSCREGQKAYEWEGRQQGIFTAHLLEGFGQGFDGIAALARWAGERTSETTRNIHGELQEPYITIEGRGDIPLPARAPRATPARRLPPSTHDDAVVHQPRTVPEALKVAVLPQRGSWNNIMRKIFAFYGWMMIIAAIPMALFAMFADVSVLGDNLEGHRQVILFLSVPMSIGMGVLFIVIGRGGRRSPTTPKRSG